ncbi:MAG: ferritin-like domain-containing protein [Myxococcales bacterium]|nr:ferritin-like domain-containing protein [Myxococcales bacterium]
MRSRFEAWVDNLNALLALENPRVMGRMVPSAVRGFVLRRGRGAPASLAAHHRSHLDFDYPSDDPQMRSLYDKAKKLQWNGATDLPWHISVDPVNPEVPLLAEDFVDWSVFEAMSGVHLNARERRGFHHRAAAWMLSQFLHGEQGALMAAAQVTEATEMFDGKLYGATQVMDEARHVEVFHRYLTEKLNLRYEINDNLYTIIDSLMTDGRWDMKFLGMQILVEGLALGAFATLYKTTSEPLLKELLRRVMHDEARHVRYGLLSLRRHYTEVLTERERAEREDWAFEVVVLMRNRFLAHELYEEGFAQVGINRRRWNEAMEQMPGMSLFRRVMFRRLVPNLRAIGLLTERIRPHYAKMRLDEYFFLPATDELSDAAVIEA